MIYRKIGTEENDIIGKFLNQISDDVKQFQNSEIDELKQQFQQYLEIMFEFTKWLRKNLKENVNDAKAAASDFQRSLGYIAIAYMWLLMSEKSSQESNDFAKDKLMTAKFYFAKVLPQMQILYQNAIKGASDIMEFNFHAGK